MRLRVLCLMLLALPSPTAAVTIDNRRSPDDAIAPDTLHHRFGGVGIVSDRRGSCTGTPISRRFVLTAAHCISTSGRGMNFTIPLQGGREIARTGRGIRYPDYRRGREPAQQKTVPDAAVIRLNGRLPARVPTYGVLDAPFPPNGQAFEFVGYGLTGNGYGTDLFPRMTSRDVKRFARNELDSVVRGQAFFSADFDYLLPWQSRLGGDGLGRMEGMIAPGDSGGPAFYNPRLAARILRKNDPDLRFGPMPKGLAIMGLASSTTQFRNSFRLSPYGTIGTWTWSGALVDWLREVDPGVNLIENDVVCPRGMDCRPAATVGRAGTATRASPASDTSPTPAPVPLGGSLGFVMAAVGAIALSGLRRVGRTRSE